MISCHEATKKVVDTYEIPNSLVINIDKTPLPFYTEAASIFGHLQHKTKRLAGQSRRTKLSIQLIHQKNLLLAQIKSSSLPEQQAALTHLLINVKVEFGLFAR